MPHLTVSPVCRAGPVGLPQGPIKPLHLQNICKTICSSLEAPNESVVLPQCRQPLHRISAGWSGLLPCYHHPTYQTGSRIPLMLNALTPNPGSLTRSAEARRPICRASLLAGLDSRSSAACSELFVCKAHHPGFEHVTNAAYVAVHVTQAACLTQCRYRCSTPAYMQGQASLLQQQWIALGTCLLESLCRQASGIGQGSELLQRSHVHRLAVPGSTQPAAPLRRELSLDLM